MSSKEFKQILSKEWHLLFLIAVLTLVALAACAPAPTVAPATAAKPTEAKAAATVHWSYEGAEGPEHWGELPGNETCATGKSQSPIDVTNPAPKDLTNIAFSYQPSEVKILNNGHTVQVNYNKGSLGRCQSRSPSITITPGYQPRRNVIDGPISVYYA
jgi:carbonic anhydrase